MRSKTLRKAGLVLALASFMVASSSPPAGAATASGGAGAVAGTVTSSGVIGTTPQPTTFTFTNSTIAGSVTAADTNGNAATFNGVITVPTISGGGTDSVVSGTGTVEGFTASGTDARGCKITVVVQSGIYTRVGGVVVVVFLKADVTITCNIPGIGTVTVSATVSIRVVALFVPTQGDGVTTPVTQAAFAGTFAATPAP